MIQNGGKYLFSREMKISIEIGEYSGHRIHILNRYGLVINYRMIRNIDDRE